MQEAQCPLVSCGIESHGGHILRGGDVIAKWKLGNLRQIKGRGDVMQIRPQSKSTAHQKLLWLSIGGYKELWKCVQSLDWAWFQGSLRPSLRSGTCHTIVTRSVSEGSESLAYASGYDGTLRPKRKKIPGGMAKG